MNMSDVNYSIENSLRPNGNEVIIGVDEVGRGCLFGPVFVHSSDAFGCFRKKNRQKF